MSPPAAGAPIDDQVYQNFTDAKKAASREMDNDGLCFILVLLPSLNVKIQHWVECVAYRYTIKLGVCATHFGS